MDEFLDISSDSDLDEALRDHVFVPQNPRLRKRRKARGIYLKPVHAGHLDLIDSVMNMIQLINAFNVTTQYE